MSEVVAFASCIEFQQQKHSPEVRVILRSENEDIETKEITPGPDIYWYFDNYEDCIKNFEDLLAGMKETRPEYNG